MLMDLEVTDNTGNASPASGGLARLGGASSYIGKATGTRQFDANIMHL